MTGLKYKIVKNQQNKQRSNKANKDDTAPTPPAERIKGIMQQLTPLLEGWLGEQLKSRGLPYEGRKKEGSGTNSSLAKRKESADRSSRRTATPAAQSGETLLRHE